MRTLALLPLLWAIGCHGEALHTMTADGGSDQSPGGGAEADMSPPCAVTIRSPDELCTSSAACPVVVHATLGCTDSGGISSVAAGPANRGFVAYAMTLGSFRPLLFTVDPDGTSGAADAPPYESPSDVVSDAAGVPSLVGTKALTPDDDGLVWFTQADVTWTAETIVTEPRVTPYGAYRSYGAAIAPDGRRYVLYANDYSPLMLATFGVGDAGWSSAAVSQSHFADNAFVLDGAGVPYSIYWVQRTPPQSGRDLVFRAGATPAQQVYYNPNGSDTGTELALAVAGPGGAGDWPVVSLNLPDAVHLFVPSGGAYTEQTIPLVYSNTTGCPNYQGIPNPSCVDGDTCTERGDGATGHHLLVRTADGQVWLAWVSAHVDQDFVIKRTCSPAGCTCNFMSTADRSTETLELASVGATLPATVRFEAPIGNTAAYLTAATRENRIYLAIGSGYRNGLDSVRYVVLDTGKL